MIGITMGDPAGIGPEILCKAWADLSGARVVYGDLRLMQAAAARFAPGLTVSLTGDADQAHHMRVVPTSQSESEIAMGQVSAAAGRASFNALENAVTDALKGQIDALVTAPINKAAWAQAGVDYPGHTEYLGKRAGRSVAMVLANDELAVVLATVHCAMREAIDQIADGAVDRILPMAYQAALDLGFQSPRIAVAGLNPHAGENGLFGDEEIRFITPAIERFGSANVSGPYSGDTVFMRARQGAFDLVVAMTHDQGLIPVKYLGVERGVNFTAGLPFVRTSPDHGTAFEIAGSGQADPQALVYAYHQAQAIVSRRSASSADG